MKELHYNRRRAREMREREAAGEDLWTEVFPPHVRAKMQNFIEVVDEYGEVREYASAVLRNGLGLRQLVRGNYSESYKLLEYIGSCADDYMPSVIEALHEGIKLKCWSSEDLWDYEGFINDLLSFERISYELIEGRMIEKQSQELHSAVVAPVITLLSHRGGLSEVEEAYQKALERLSQRDTAGALTASATALQEMLKACGCTGRTLGEQAKEAQGKGLLARGDSPLLEGIKKTLDWASGVRNTRGDSHQITEVATEEAWLMVHIVGALILRIAQGMETG